MVGGFGTVVCVGIPPPTELMQLHPITFIDKGISLAGSVVGSRADIEEGEVIPNVLPSSSDKLTEHARECATGKVCSLRYISL